MAPPEEVGFKYIQEVQQRESRSHNLTKLPADFFEALAVHIARLRELVRQEMARDPMATTATLAQNELKNTLRLAQDIVMLRLRKMASRAVDALEGGKVDLRSLTPREKDLYAEMARFMSASLDQLLPLTGMAARPPTPATSRPPSTPEDQAGAEEAGEEGGREGGSVGTAVAPTGGPAEDQVPDSRPPEEEGSALVHVLKDMPSFAGEGGRTYSLRRGDLVTLPKRLVDILVSRGAVEEVQQVP